MKNRAKVSQRWEEWKGPLAIGAAILILGCLITRSWAPLILVLMFSPCLILLVLVALGVFDE